MTQDTATREGLILAIEAAVRGGSIALVQNSHEIAAWHGKEAVSRAEELLPNIADLLEQTKIRKKDVKLIAVSNGPGSYTGIRIGLSTALGLARALEIECVGVSLLPAIAIMHSRGSKCLVVIPIGRTEFCWQQFTNSDGNNACGPPMTGLPKDFLKHCHEAAGYDLLMQHDAYEAVMDVAEFNDFRSRAYNCGRNLALCVGIGVRRITSDLTPLYVRNSQFSSGGV